MSATTPAPELTYGSREEALHDHGNRLQLRAKVCGVSKRHRNLARYAALEPAWNEKAKAVAASVAEFEGSGTSVLALIGARGTGKTQLCCAAVHECLLRDRYARIVNAMELGADLKAEFGIQGGSESEWLIRWTGPYLFVIDEFGDLVAGEHVRAMITLLVDRRYADCRPTIIVGNLSREQFVAAVGPSIADRCNEGGGVLVCDWPSFRR